MTGHADATIDALLDGFALQEASLPATAGAEMSELAGSIAAQMPADTVPCLAEFTVDRVLQPGYDFGDECEFGLDLLLDGLADAARSDV